MRITGSITTGSVRTPSSFFSNASLFNNECYSKNKIETQIDLHITLDDGSELTELSPDTIVAILRAVGKLEPKKRSLDE